MILKLISVVVMVFGTLDYSGATDVIDPWIIGQREAIDLALLNCTLVPDLFGEDNLGNILWGLEIQSHWQVISGRQQSKPSSTRIDENAWFSNVNYFLTVVPYLAAINSNLLPPTEFLPPQSNPLTEFPITYESIDPEIAQDWTNYFEAVKNLQADPNYMSLESLQRILWEAHSTVITKSLPKFEPKIKLLNVKERKFANGFAHFVELAAVVNLNTSYPPMYALNKLLPQRVLKVWDTPPLILDMTPLQNVAISSYFAIDDMTQVPLVWTQFLQTIRNGMAIVNCAVKLQKAFYDFLTAPNAAITSVLLSIASTC